MKNKSLLLYPSLQELEFEVKKLFSEKKISLTDYPHIIEYNPDARYYYEVKIKSKNIERTFSKVIGKASSCYLEEAKMVAFLRANGIGVVYYGE